MYYSDDPLRDFDRWDADQAAAEARLPICVECGYHIMDEEAYYFEGDWICVACMDEHKRTVEPDG